MLTAALLSYFLFNLAQFFLIGFIDAFIETTVGFIDFLYYFSVFYFSYFYFFIILFLFLILNVLWFSYFILLRKKINNWFEALLLSNIGIGCYQFLLLPLLQPTNFEMPCFICIQLIDLLISFLLIWPVGYIVLCYFFQNIWRFFRVLLLISNLILLQ